MFAKLGRTALACNLFSHLRPRLKARGTTASLQRRTDDGVLTAAMIYDRQPIVDYFCRSADKVVGKWWLKEIPAGIFSDYKGSMKE